MYRGLSAWAKCLICGLSVWSLVWVPAHAGPEKKRHSEYRHAEKDWKKTDKKAPAWTTGVLNMAFPAVMPATGRCSTVIPVIRRCRRVCGKT